MSETEADAQDKWRLLALTGLRGDWWRVGDRILRGREVVAFYHAIPDDAKMRAAIGFYGTKNTHSVWVRTLSILKRLGLIERRNGSWART